MHRTGLVLPHEGDGKCTMILVGKPEGKLPVGSFRRTWEHVITLARKEVGCQDIDWIQLAHNMVQWRPVTNTVMKNSVPKKVGNFLTS
jgi:hypothetical protein